MVCFTVLLRVSGAIDQNNEKRVWDVRCPAEAGSRYITRTFRRIISRVNSMDFEERAGLYQMINCFGGPSNMSYRLQNSLLSKELTIMNEKKCTGNEE
jgi:hypothetical protein